MPLLDHFHAPMSEEVPWDSFNTLWVASIVGYLNHSLPRDQFRAFASIHLGPQVEADVAEFERLPDPPNLDKNGVATQTVAPPATISLPAQFPDNIEIRITDIRNTQRLVGVIELISPSNKKEPKERRAFAIKCAAYLQKGIGLMMIDIVTHRHANLHNELLELLGLGSPFLFSNPTPTYVTSYHPVHREEKNWIDCWQERLEVGNPLPSIPFVLRGGDWISLPLEETYLDACETSGLE
jgi:hypothetical protein